MFEFPHLTWKPIQLTTTYTHTVIIIVDEVNHTTRTTTELVAIPPSEIIHHPMPTNSAGTVTQRLTYGDHDDKITVL
jgi:hypothetical protein